MGIKAKIMKGVRKVVREEMSQFIDKLEPVNKLEADEFKRYIHCDPIEEQQYLEPGDIHHDKHVIFTLIKELPRGFWKCRIGYWRQREDLNWERIEGPMKLS